MIQEKIVIDVPFHPYRMGRIDGIINEKIASMNLDRGVVKIRVPEKIFMTTIEYEPNLVEDFSQAYAEFNAVLKPKTSAQILSKLPGNEICVPYNLGKLVLGDWQQLVLYTLEQFESITMDLEFSRSESILGLENIHTDQELQTHDVTDIVERSLMNITDGYVTMMTPDSSAILYSLRPEYYPDLVKFLKDVAPYSRKYKHRHEWNDHVGYIHIRASFICQLLTLPVKDGYLVLNGERVYLTELDVSHRRRDIYFEVWK